MVSTNDDVDWNIIGYIVVSGVRPSEVYFTGMVFLWYAFSVMHEMNQNHVRSGSSLVHMRETGMHTYNPSRSACSRYFCNIQAKR